MFLDRIITHIIDAFFRFPRLRHVVWFFSGLLLFTGALYLVFRVSSVSTNPVGWERSFALSPARFSAKSARLASRGNFIAAVYEAREGGENWVYVSLSFDGGGRFLKPVRIAGVRGGIDHNPRVAVSSGGHVAVVWQDFAGDDVSSRLIYSISSDMGASWSPPVRVNRTTDIEMEMLPGIFYDDRQHLHIFFHAFRGDVFNLFHSVSPDEKTFTHPDPMMRVTEGLKGAFFPSIRFSGSRVFVVLQAKGFKFADDLYFLKSDDYGKSWSSRRRITLSPDNDTSPSLLLLGSTIYVAYQNNEGRNWAIYLMKGTEYGEHWGNPIKISETSANCYSPVIVNSENQELIILWHDLRKVTPAVFARRYDLAEMDIKKRLGPEIMLSRSGITSRLPDAVSLGKKVVILWQERDRVIVNYSDVYVAPPVVFSRTHRENSWSRSASALIEWRPPADESGIVGYATSYSDDPGEVPLIQDVGRSIRKRKVFGRDGVSYFHIRAYDGAGNASRTVHYRIQISKTPLQIVNLTSSTHPPGKAVKALSPLFTWDVNSLERVKGFQYSLSRDRVSKPNRFTTTFVTGFKNLEEGRYFFSIRAIDKTNSPGPVDYYEVIVGKASGRDVDYLKNIARGDADEDEGKPRRAPVKKPTLVVKLPFDAAAGLQERNFSAMLTPLNIPPAAIAGYSVVVDSSRTEAPERVNLKENRFTVKDLKNGEYYISARCKYSRGSGAKKTYHWTKTVTQKFQVRVPIEVSPLVAYTDDVLTRLASRWLVMAVIVLGMTGLVVTLGFGGRTVFYLKYLRYRIASLI